MSDNAPVKVVTVCRRDIMMNQHSMLCNFNAMTVTNYLCCLNPTVPFSFSIDYLLESAPTKG